MILNSVTDGIDMNERIRELAEQALFESDFDDEQNIKITLDIFAELIVGQCIRIGQETSKEIFKMSKTEGDIFEHKSHGAEEVVDNIKEHFGVRE